MPTQTPTIGPIRPDSIPMGSDFVGGAEALPVRSTGPGEVVPGSDFAGGALPLTTQVERGEADKEQAAQGMATTARGGGTYQTWPVAQSVGWESGATRRLGGVSHEPVRDREGPSVRPGRQQ
jgi:hypothetical protein